MNNFICHLCLLIKPANDKVPLYYRIFIAVLNIFITPFILIYYSCTIYLIPCVTITVSSCLNRCLFSKCLLFTDKEFLPNNQALGNLEANIKDIQWIRLQDMVKKDDTYKNAVIFDDTISAEDVCQGALGDCYLLAAFATLCERKVFIQNCFLTTTYNPYGKYKLRFYDLKAKRYVVIVIDDYIPCNNNKKPIFTKFNGHEMWPLLLEKAYAKFKGNYHNIEKGNPLVALKELTGFEGEQFIGGFNEEFFKKLQRYSNYGALMTASSKGKDNTKQQHDNGVVLKSSIVPGHAYSILDIKTPMLTTSRIYLLKLRNPWYSSYGTLYLL
jgi:hypothetical protein